MTAHSHPVLGEILALQASMSSSWGKRWHHGPVEDWQKYLNLQEVPGHGLWLFLYTADLTRAGWLAFHEKEPRKLQCHYQFLKHLRAQSPLQVFLPAHNAPTTRQHPLLPRWKPGAVLAAKQASCSVGRTQRQFSGAWAAADAGAMGKTEVKGYNSSTYNVYYGALVLHVC